MPGTSHLIAQSASFVFWDATGNGNPIGAYQCVSLATQAEVDAAVAAGHGHAMLGATVVATPINTGVATRRVLGVTQMSQASGREVSVALDGFAEVMVNEAVAVDTLLFAVAAETRTNLQTPLVNLPLMVMPVAPDLPQTYNLCLVNDLAITPASGGANALYWPVGIALEVATAKYDVIQVQLMLQPMYA